MSELETIPFVDLVGQYHRYKDELDAAISGVLETAAFIGGKHVAAFEAAFSDYCGGKHAVGVGNGTDALYLTLRGLGLGASDEVIIPANTFIATAEAVSMTGAKPVFVDVVESTALIDPALVEAAITERTKAIMPVHLYGQLVPMQPVLDIAEKHDLVVIEDAAQAHGAETGGKRAGTFGKAAGFSFYPGKNLGAYGDGGAMVTDDAKLADKVRRLANHGRAQKYGHDMEGVNSRLDGLQAAILGVKLKHLETATKERQAAAARYDELLKDVVGVTTPTVLEKSAHVFHLYVIRVEDRGGLRQHLVDNKIQCGVHYPIPLHQQPAYEHLGYQTGAFGVSERLSQEILSLPMSPELTEAQQERIVGAVKSFMEESS